MGTIVRMTKAKVTVTMDKELVAKVRRAVEDGRAASVSAYVEQAVAQWVLEEEASGSFFDEMLENSGGPLTDQERADIDRKLGWA
jgi:Arc/MetJ-type ribon-helix-helix transcriptional regulator